MGEILADAAPAGQHLAHRGMDVGRSGRVDQIAMRKTHDRQRGLPGVGDPGGRIDRQAPDVRVRHRQSGRSRDNRSNRCVLDSFRQGGQRRRGGVGGQRGGRMGGDHRPAFNQEAGVRGGDLEMMDAIGIEVVVLRG